MVRVTVKDGIVDFALNDKLFALEADEILDPDPNPVTPKLAATVMLVRDSKPGQTKYRIEDGVFPPDFPNNQNVEVFMIRRMRTMDFAPDAVAFPGGRVDERDANPDLPWCGPTAKEWAKLMSVSEDDARRIVVAAAREVFEESGVLLVGPNEHSIVSDLDDPWWKETREALIAHKVAFADVLIERNLVLRTDLLGLISNWCTPAYVSKRFDTFFFTAMVPEGQQADGNTSEAQIAGWVTPSYAVREFDEDRWLLFAPTLYNLGQIAQAHSAEELVETRRKVQKITQAPVFNEDGSVVMRAQVDATRKF